MSEFHDDYPNYEMMAHHSEEEGKVMRKKLWQVFFIMLAITIGELVVGFNAEKWGFLTPLRGTTFGLKFFFVFFTIVKAGYIVLSFMHLGHEQKALKWVILGPYITFIVYLMVMGSIGEGGYSSDPSRRPPVDQNVLDQSQKMKTTPFGHVEHEGTNHERVNHEGVKEGEEKKAEEKAEGETGGKEE